MKKKGQVTIFIIIGIVILAGVAMYLYIKQQKVIEEEITVTETVPQEFLPIKNYVQECQRRAAREAIVRLGLQGGYIYLPDKINFNPLSYIEIVPDGFLKLPLWYYKGENRVPTIEDMQSQIGRYVSFNTENCVKGFADFEDKYEIVKLDNVSTKAVLGERGVILTTTYPVLATLRGTAQSTKISQYQTDVNVDLLRIYGLATEIMDSENKETFMENLTIDLMTAGPQIPFSDITFECARPRWFVPDIKENIQNLLYYNLLRVRFKNTNHEPFIDKDSVYEKLRGYPPELIMQNVYPEYVPEDAYDYFNFYWKATDKDYKDLEANMLYMKDWGLELAARPSDGNIMEASSGKGMQEFLRFLCINVYHFTYDVVYPVQVIIRDNDAFEGDGYDFSFAFPVMINHNAPDRSDFVTSIYNVPDKPGNYCEALSDREIKVLTRNKRTFEDIKGSNITFECVGTYTCPLGETIADGGVYRLRAYLPSFCSPGTIIAEHTGFTKASKDVTDNDVIEVYMTPMKTMQFEIKKQRLTKDVLQASEPLEEGEKAVLSLVTDDFEDFEIYRKFDITGATPSPTIDMPVGEAKYKLDIILIGKNDEMIGGYIGEWKVDEADIADNNKIIFNVVEKIPHPLTDADKVSLVLEMEGRLKDLAIHKFE